MDRAIPCGLILNETFMNVRKYAFPEGFSEDRKVGIRLKRTSGGLVELTVRDTGVGLPPS